jgi:hypothetical protein
MKILAVPTHLVDVILILRMALALVILRVRLFKAVCLRSWKIKISPRILKLTSKLKLLGA